MSKKNLVIYYILISIGILFYFFANFQRIAVPGAIFDILQGELSVSAQHITMFGAIFMYVYACTQLINGVLVDRFGGFRIILCGGVILGIGALLFPISSNLFIMYISRGLIGLGSSMFYLSLIKELKGIVSEKNFGIAISVMLFLGYTGGIVANAPFVYAMKYATWHEILIIMASVILIGALIFALILMAVELPKPNKSVKLKILPFRLILHKKHNRNLFSFACCNFGISYAIQTIIGKKFLEDFCLMSVSRAALVLSFMALIGAIFNIVNAYICRVFDNHRVRFLKKASVITFGSLLAICIFIFLDIKTEFVAVLFFVLAANASLSSILVPVLHLTNRKMVSSTAVGIMNFSFFMMVGILGTIMGHLMELFTPIQNGVTVIYPNNSYLAVFGMFLLLSIFEMYKAMKLSDKY